MAQGEQLELTVRPEKIELSAERPAAGDCALRGTVTEVVYLGTSTSFAVTTTTGADIVVFQQNSASAGDDRQPRGQRLALVAVTALVPDRLASTRRGSHERAE